MLSTPPVHRSPPRTDWYPDKEQKPTMAPLKDSPHDVVITIEELKTLLKRITVAGITAMVGIGLHFQSRLLDLDKHNNSQDLSIQQLSMQTDYIKDQLTRMQTFIDASQRNQSDIIVQLGNLRVNMATTEQISRETQSRLENLADYLRKNSKISGEPSVNNYDTINKYKFDK
jgi:hypothetical protein